MSIPITVTSTNQNDIIDDDTTTTTTTSIINNNNNNQLNQKIVIENINKKKFEQKMKQIKIKTLVGDITINLPTNDENFTTHDLKLLLCNGSSPFIPDDILLVSKGNELKNDDIIIYKQQQQVKEQKNDVIFALIRSSVNTIAKVNVKSTNNKSSKIYKDVEFPVNSKIFHFKRELQKLTGIKSSAMRIIISARVLKESCIIGDYLLLASIKKNCSSSKPTSNTTTSPLLVHVSKSIDFKQEIKLNLFFGQVSNFTITWEIGSPLSYIEETLWRSYAFPKYMKFTLAYKEDNNDIIIYDMNKSLFENGVTNSSLKSINLYMIKNQDLGVVDTLKCSGLDVANLYKRNDNNKNDDNKDSIKINNNNESNIENKNQFNIINDLLASNGLNQLNCNNIFKKPVTLQTKVDSIKRNNTIGIEKKPKNTSMFSGLKKGFLSSSSSSNKSNNNIKKEKTKK
jgi:hypothetical protein